MASWSGVGWGGSGGFQSGDGGWTIGGGVGGMSA
jgi:hypothetical protein